MSNAAATLVVQNLGAGEPARAEATVWRIGWMNMAFTLAVSVAFLFLHDDLVALFTDDAQVMRFSQLGRTNALLAKPRRYRGAANSRELCEETGRHGEYRRPRHPRRSAQALSRQRGLRLQGPVHRFRYMAICIIFFHGAHPFACH